jgi:hypothetical protein
MIHAFNSVLMVTDLFLVAHPFRLLHCYWPLLATVCYIAFSYIYYEFGGTDRQDRPVVYSLLDWRLPSRAAIASCFGLLVSLSIHCFAWFLFLIRKWIALLIKEKTALPTHEEKNHTLSEMQPALQMNDIICWLLQLADVSVITTKTSIQYLSSSCYPSEVQWCHETRTGPQRGLMYVKFTLTQGFILRELHIGSGIQKLIGKIHRHTDGKVIT